MLEAISREEVHNIVLSLPNDKAPGIDGFPVEFFKKNWQMVVQEVTGVVLDFFSNGKLLKRISCTIVALVPKVANPNFVKEFISISCCNTMYKIIAKLLTYKLKKVVDFLVGPFQYAFIEGRNILDNVIVTHELVKGYGKKHVSFRRFMKNHIRKAYDSVEWGFIEVVLLVYGFPSKMVS